MDKLLVSPSPHLHRAISTKSIMLDFIIALLPAVIVSALFYGFSELLILAVSVLSCVAVEWVATKFLLKKNSTIGDLSAVVTARLPRSDDRELHRADYKYGRRCDLRDRRRANVFWYCLRVLRSSW